jgi:hypothetical protein
MRSVPRKDKMKQPTHSILNNKLKKLHSLIVRTRDKKCLKCGKTDTLQCAHVFSCKHKNTVWDEDNAVTLCFACHFYWAHKDPLEFTEWIKKRWGEDKYWEMMLKHNIAKKWTLSEKVDLAVKLTLRLTGLQGVK